MTGLRLAILRTIRAASFASEAHLVSMCGGNAASVKRALESLRAEGMVGWGPTLGYWVQGKGEEAATGNFAVQVRVGRP